ncbi:MAG: glycosyl transferase [Methylomonas sp.]|nr:MAG: glycosyl transferase [Methylomonas sp.]
MKFSLIIPLYNKAPYIAQTLQSVLAQSWQDFEIIVVDDGSTDASVEIVKRFKHPQIRLVQQLNAGVSVARNHGISLASGEWIGFLDGDDSLHPAYFASIVEMMNAYPTIDVLASRFRVIADSPAWPPEVWQLQAPTYQLIDDLPTRWMQGIPFFTGSIVIRATLLKSFMPCFPEGESFGEDMDLWFRLAEVSTIVLSDQPLAVYRNQVAGGLISQQQHSLIAPYLLRMQLRALQFPPHHPQRISMLRYVCQQYITQARLEVAKGRRGQAFTLLSKVWQQGLTVKRWWSTLIMLLTLPGAAIQRWQTWRKLRTLTQ